MRIFERWYFGLCWNLRFSYYRVMISWKILGFFFRGFFFWKINIFFAWWNILNFHNSSFFALVRYFWMLPSMFVQALRKPSTYSRGDDHLPRLVGWWQHATSCAKIDVASHQPSRGDDHLPRLVGWWQHSTSCAKIDVACHLPSWGDDHLPRLVGWWHATSCAKIDVACHLPSWGDDHLPRLVGWWYATSCAKIDVACHLPSWGGDDLSRPSWWQCYILICSQAKGGVNIISFIHSWSCYLPPFLAI